MLKHCISIISLILLANAYSFASFTLRPSGGKATGMGNAFVSQYDVFSVYHNQAGLANIERTSFSFFYENQFFIPDLNTRAALVAFPTNVGNFAVNYNAFGPSKWAQSNVGLTYSRFLTKQLSAGIQFNYFGIRMPEINKTAASASFELGVIYQLTEKTFLGAHVANPYSPPINTFVYEESIPWRVSIGGHTNFTDKFTCSYEAELVQNQNPIAQIGANWEAANNFFIRGGFSSGPARFSAGFGYVSEYLTIDTAFAYHQYAGYTPSVSLIFSFF